MRHPGRKVRANTRLRSQQAHTGASCHAVPPLHLSAAAAGSWQLEVLTKTALEPQEPSHLPLGKNRLWGLGVAHRREMVTLSQEGMALSLLAR